RHDRGIGEEDGPLRDRARSAAHIRLWRGTVGVGPGKLFLASGSAHCPRHRFRYALSARLRMALFSGAKTRGRGDEAHDGGTLMGRYVFKLPDVGEGTAEAEIVAWHVKPGDAVS